MLTVTAIRHAWPESAGFTIDRKNGHPDYTFLHFFGGIEIDVGGERITAPHHTCILYRPGTPQNFHSRQDLIHDWIHLSGDVEPLLARLNLPTDTLLHPQLTDFITDLIREMESEFFSQKSGKTELLCLKTEELLIKLSRACHGEYGAPVDTTTEERLRKLRGEVFLSLRHPWTVAEMAARMNLSQSRFFSVYRSFYGNSPTDDLIRARIDAAKNALAFTDQPVARIAENLGYNNLTHFIRQFKALTGVSPSVYRKEHNTRNIIPTFSP